MDIYRHAWSTGKMALALGLPKIKERGLLFLAVAS